MSQYCTCHRHINVHKIHLGFSNMEDLFAYHRFCFIQLCISNRFNLMKCIMMYLMIPNFTITIFEMRFKALMHLRHSVVTLVDFTFHYYFYSSCHNFI